MGNFDVIFCGTNGSCSYNAGNRKKYGTNSLCVAVSAGGNNIIFDSGSGICGVSDLKEFKNNSEHLFFSHYHIDHISGFIFHKSLYNPQKIINIYGMTQNGKNSEEIISNYVVSPYHPINLKNIYAKLNFSDAASGKVFELENNVKVSAVSLHHPGGCIGYKVQYEDKSVCYFTDIEIALQNNDDVLTEFAQNCSLLIMDSFFDDSNYIKDWGHSTWRECCEFAKKVNAEKLALYHHNFRCSDEYLDEIGQKAKEVFSGSFVSYDGQKFSL